jgi:hypothetical protein
MPDDPIADLGKKLDTLDKRLGQVDKKLGGLEKSAQLAATAQQELQRQLDALGQQVTTYRTVQLARTALLDARAEHDRQFGHHQLVRRSVTGMLRAMATGTVRPAALLRAAEQLMIDAAGYWLSPAQLALAAWVDDSQESAERAVLEAVRRDPGRSTLFFSLVLARFGRPDAAARWITEYARAQDPHTLTGEFTAVLDAGARGALGGPARERLLDACRGWRDQIGPPGDREAEQVASWTGFIRGQRPPLTDTFHPLGTVSRDWAATLGRLAAATAFGHTEQWLKGRLGGTSEGEQTLRAAVDDLLRNLVAAPDQAEGALLDAARRWQAIIDSDSDSDSNGNGNGNGQPATLARGEPGRTDFLTLATAIATGTYSSELSAQAARFCLLLSRATVERAVTELSQQVRSTCPASIEVDIEGWHHAVEPGDDPDVLVEEFVGWAARAMTEDKDKATRKRLSLGRPSARLEHIESDWEARKRQGQETVYRATAQVNNFFRDWQHGIAAAARCVEELRAQPTGEWSDPQQPRTLAGPARPVMPLPGWDPRPPG